MSDPPRPTRTQKTSVPGAAAPKTAQTARAPSALDLRLAPPALSTWVAAWAATGATGPLAWAHTALACAAAVLVCLALVVAVGRSRPPRHRLDPRPGAQHLPLSALGSATASALLTTLAVVAVLLVTSAHQATRAADPLTRAMAQQHPVTLTGTLAQAPRATLRGHDTVVTQLGLDGVDGQPSGLSVLVVGRGPWAQAQMGQRVRLRATPRPAPAGQRVAALVSSSTVRVMEEPQGLTGAVTRLRASARQALAGLSLAGANPPPGSHELVTGLALGDDSRLPPGLREELRTVSLTHLTAVSGQHVAIVLGLVLSTLGVLPRRLRAAVGLVVLAGLVVLVRPGGSVLRASAMGVVMLLGVAAGRRALALPALLAAVVVLLLADPWQARDYGFALSVLATAAILLWSRPCQAWLSRFVPRWVALGLALPLVAQGACMPVLVLLVPQWSPWAVLANALAAPPVAVATVSGMASALLSALAPQVARLVALPALAGCAWVVAVAEHTAHLPGAALPWPPGPGGAMLMALAETTVVAGAWRLERWRRKRRRRAQERMWQA